MKIKNLIAFTLLVCTLVLTACGGAVTGVSPEESTSVVSPTETSVVLPTETLVPTVTLVPTLVSTNTPPPTVTPRPTLPPVYSDPAKGFPYFEGSELIDVFAMSKAKCVSYLYSDNPSRIAEVMQNKGLTEPEAVADICTPPVVACETIPSPYVRIPILDLGEKWAEGVKNSRFAGMYQHVPLDQFVPGTDYCFMDLGQSLAMNPNGERPSLCHDSSRVGLPAKEEDCIFAALEIPEPGTRGDYSKGRYVGSIYYIDDLSDADWEYQLTQSFSNWVGNGWTLEEAGSLFSSWGNWIVVFEISNDPYLQNLGWEPVAGIIYVP